MAGLIRARKFAKWKTGFRDVDRYICSKASKRLYAIRLLKRSGVSISDLTHIFCSVVRPILEYGCQIWHFSLTEKQSNQIEQIQRRATKTILSDQISYDLRLERLKLITLAERREELCRKLFQSITQNKNDKLNGLLPQPKEHTYSLRIQENSQCLKRKRTDLLNHLYASLLNYLTIARRRIF